MGAPRKPDVAHVAPLEGESSFVCSGPCALVWSTAHRSRRHRRSRNICENCGREARRSLITPEETRRAHLKKTYGVTPERVLELLRAQEHRCPVCTRPLILPAGTGGVRKGEAVVDHDHDTKVVRGMLCSKCNTAIGLLNDDAESAGRAAAYLKAANAQAKPEGLPRPRAWRTRKQLAEQRSLKDGIARDLAEQRSLKEETARALAEEQVETRAAVARVRAEGRARRKEILKAEKSNAREKIKEAKSNAREKIKEAKSKRRTWTAETHAARTTFREPRRPYAAATPEEAAAVDALLASLS